jgi:blocked-early-in-transport protein 1
VRGIEFQDSS